MTKKVIFFKAMVRIAKTFEQCKKTKALMQQAKGPAEQVNFATSGSSVFGENKLKPKFSKQGDSVVCQFCGGPTHLVSVQRKTNDVQKGCGRIGNLQDCVE